MLVITKAQQRALRRARLRDFVRRSLPRVKRKYATQVTGAGDPQLEQRLLEAVETAHDFGIVRAEHLRRFMGSDLLLGAAFASDPERSHLRELLTSRELTPEEKLDQLDEFSAFPG